MPEIRITLSVIWVVVMLIYLLGDVLRIISVDAARGMDRLNLNQWGWLP